MKSASKAGWPAKLRRRDGMVGRRRAARWRRRFQDNHLPATATVDDIRSIYLATRERAQSRSREPCFFSVPLLLAQVR